MKKKIALSLTIVGMLSACAGFNEKSSTASKVEAPKQEKPVVKVAEAKTIDFEAMAKTKAAEQSGKQVDTKKVAEQQAAAEAEAKAAAAAAKAKREAAEKAAAEKIAKEEEASRKVAEQKNKQLEEETAKKQEQARVAAEKAQQEKALKEQQEQQKLAKEQADVEAKAAELKAQQEAQAQRIAEAAEKARLEAEAKAEQERASQEVARREAAARAAAEAKAAEEKRTAAASEARNQAIVASQKVSATKGFYLPNFKGAQLDSQEFTPMGAERKGNADGSIPAWTGSMNGVPRGLTYRQSGDVYPDPYASDRVVTTIRAGNMEQHADRLSEGLKMMFRKYPDTFYMNVYPTHRDGRYNDVIEARTKWNLANTRLVNGADGLNKYTGGAPFPFPKNANEALWNGRIIHPSPTVNGVFDDMAVYLNGNMQQRRQIFVSEFPFAYQDNPVGKTDEEISVNAAFVHVTIEKPDRQKGQMTIIHEALDQAKNERMAWVYIPGSRRVRRAPTVGYDTPDGPGGLATVDDSLGFNGAVDRYDWKLLGKKEVYIPYHSYKFDNPKVPYSTLLQKGHANPEYMRYELHRVWVVEAELKKEARHVYAKRRFYIDEDSWHIVLLESYDGRGDLWRVGILNTVYDFAVKGFVARAQMFHDLQSGGYLAMRLVNETSPTRMLDTPKGENYYSPANLRQLGK